MKLTPTENSESNPGTDRRVYWGKNAVGLSAFVVVLWLLNVTDFTATIAGTPVSDIPRPDDISGIDRLIVDEFAPLLLVGIKLFAAAAVASFVRHALDGRFLASVKFGPGQLDVDEVERADHKHAAAIRDLVGQVETLLENVDANTAEIAAIWDELSDTTQEPLQAATSQPRAADVEGGTMYDDHSEEGPANGGS